MPERKSKMPELVDAQEYFTQCGLGLTANKPRCRDKSPTHIKKTKKYRLRYIGGNFMFYKGEKLMRLRYLGLLSIPRKCRGNQRLHFL